MAKPSKSSARSSSNTTKTNNTGSSQKGGSVGSKKVCSALSANTTTELNANATNSLGNVAKSTHPRWTFLGTLALLVFAVLFGWYSYPQHPLYHGNITELGGGYDFFHSYCIVNALNAKIANVYSSQELLDFSRNLSNGKNWAINDNHLLPFYVLYQPLAKRDFSSAYYIHLWANLNIYWLAAFALTLSIFPSRKQAYAIMAAIILATVTIGPAVDNIWLGQISFAFTGLLALAFLLDRANFQKAAGVCLAVTILLKMYPALLLLYFGLKKRWKLLLWVLYTIIALSLVAGIQWGFAHYANYLDFLFHTMSYNSNVANQSFIGVVANACPYLASNELKLVHLAFLLLITGGLVWFTHSLPRRFANISWGMLEYSLWLVLATVASPLSWGHHHVLLLLPWLALLGLALGTNESIVAPTAPTPQPERNLWSAPCCVNATVRRVAWTGMAAIVALWCCEGETVTNPTIKGFHYAFCQHHGGLVGLLIIARLISACLWKRPPMDSPSEP